MRLWLIVAGVSLVLGASGSARAASADCTTYEVAEAEGAAGSIVCAAELPASPPGGVGYRLLYRTRDTAGAPVLASGLVFLPQASGGGVGTILLAHSTTGLEPACGPSAFWRPDDATSQRYVPGVPEIVASGKALLVPDYIGLGATPSDAAPPAHPFLEPRATARALVDGFAAAMALPTHLAGHGEAAPATPDGRLVLVGHSQGGHAVLAAATPFLQAAAPVRLKGLVASGAPGRIDRLLTLQRSIEGAVFTSYILTSVHERQPQLALEAIAAKRFLPLLPKLARGCLFDEAVLAGHVAELVGAELLADPLTGATNANYTFGRPLASGSLAPGWASAIGALTPPPPPAGSVLPTVLVNGGLDEIVPPFETAETVVQALCMALADRLRVMLVPFGEHDRAFTMAQPSLLPFAVAAVDDAAAFPPARIGEGVASILTVGCKDFNL